MRSRATSARAATACASTSSLSSSARGSTVLRATGSLSRYRRACGRQCLPQPARRRPRAAHLEPEVRHVHRLHDDERRHASRASGTWAADGFGVGDAIQLLAVGIFGLNNDGAYRIEAIDATGTILTLVNLDGTTPTLVGETTTHLVVRTELLVPIDSIDAGTDVDLELRTAVRQGGIGAARAMSR